MYTIVIAIYNLGITELFKTIRRKEIILFTYMQF